MMVLEDEIKNKRSSLQKPEGSQSLEAKQHTFFKKKSLVLLVLMKKPMQLLSLVILNK